ncbi:hypothetical protein [Actinacidiphila soli]|uniref:hypothetical protein n=1 Tax=Actinacidiphila soli TaxID=2487275 RepID=UPI0013E35D21|nr:hypothetical protein [Actinacidiphila soli]
MPVLRSMVAMSRMLRHVPHIGADLPPDDAVLLDAPDDRLAAATARLDDGDFKPVAELLAWTRDAAWWETRDRHVAWLAERHLEGGTWLREWLDADPDSPDVAVVRAEAAVRHAWRAPSAADRVALLREAGPLVRDAAEASTGDPVPWRTAITRARGLRAQREDFDGLWAQAVARSPHHFGCHVSALRFLRDDEQCGQEEFLAFAADAADSVLPGSLVLGLPLIAVYESLLSGRPGAASYVDSAITAAQELSAWHSRGDREPAEVRNVLIQMLILRKRWAEALDQFRATGIHATAFPWRHTGEPRREFLEMRTGVRVQLASGVRLWAKPGGPYT